MVPEGVTVLEDGIELKGIVKVSFLVIFQDQELNCKRARRSKAAMGQKSQEICGGVGHGLSTQTSSSSWSYG